MSDTMAREVLNSKNNPLKGRINQIRGGDHKWSPSEFEILFEDVKNDNFSTIGKRMLEVRNYIDKNNILKNSDEEDITNRLTSDITRCATNTGWFGKNIKASEKNRCLVDDANSKLVFKYVIDNMTESFIEGEEDLNNQDLLNWSFSSNMGHNPIEFHPWSSSASDKIDFVHRFFDEYRPEHTYNSDRKIVQGYRKTFDKPDKLRPNFIYNRSTGALEEGTYTALNQPMRVRSIASVPWYDNSYLMYVNQCLMIGKNKFLKKHIGFNTNTLEDIINSSGKEAFATDVASADYTHKEKDLKYFFETFLDGRLEGLHEGLFKNMGIVGGYIDDKGKDTYYHQKNRGRFLSGTGLTYWLNVAKYLTCQILNLISYERNSNKELNVWDRNARLITEKEILAVVCLNKGDDALDFIVPGTSKLYENIISRNPYIQAEKEPFCTFDGLRVVGDPGKYRLRAKYKTFLLNTIEKRELRKETNPNNSFFYSGQSGKIDYMNMYPTIDKEVGMEIMRLNHYMITGNVKFDPSVIKERAALEEKYLIDNQRASYIMKAVRFLNLRNINELNYNVNGRDLGTLPQDILDNIFVTRKMIEIRTYFREIF